MSEAKRLTIRAALHIKKPIEAVYSGIAKKEEMTNYFISWASQSIEKEGDVIEWQFPEMDLKFPVRVGKLDPPNSLEFFWDDENGAETFVRMELLSREGGLTKVTVSEGEKPADEAGIEWYGRNTEGWANFLACLKAWLEHGIHLRRNAFGPEQMPEAKNQ